MDYESVRKYLGGNEGPIKTKAKRFDISKLSDNLFSLDDSVEDFLGKFQPVHNKKEKSKKRPKVVPVEELEEIGAEEPDILDSVLEDISKLKSYKK
jgi:hypothetical protein